MTYEVKFIHLDSRPLAVVRRRAARAQLARVVPEACGAVWNVIKSQNVTGAGRHVAVYLDDQINMEIGVELNSPFTGHGDVIISATPAGRVATTTHHGPYAALSFAHETVQRYCTKRGLTLAGPRWEIYGHWLDEWNDDPSKIVTDVFYLLAPEAAAAT